MSNKYLVSKKQYWTNCKDNESIIRRMIYLYDRYQDEKEYESFSEYAKELRKLFPDVIKTSVRPFGIIANCEDGQITISLKISGKKAYLTSKI